MADYPFKGGVQISDAPPSGEILDLPPPQKVIVSLHQRVGNVEPAVSPGDLVFAAAPLVHLKNPAAVMVHSPISGVVRAIEKVRIPNPLEIYAPAIIIEADNKNAAVEPEPLSGDFHQYEPSVLVEKIRRAGIVGMGGAGFPTHLKLQTGGKIETIIVNATECDPSISCDDALIQKFPHEILRGAALMRHICAAKSVIIAIEDDKPEAYDMLQKHNTDAQISIRKIPTKYTSGAAKLLVKYLFGIELGGGRLTESAGILCQNVGTVKAIDDAIFTGLPLISRMMTVADWTQKRMKNYAVRIGTPFADFIDFENLNQNLAPNLDRYKIRAGGMMMGAEISNLDYAVEKTTNCIFFKKRETAPVRPCIRCGMCHEVCPIGLLPQQLYWYAKSENLDKAADNFLDDCIECGCCSYVCPSHIPLVDYFQFAKTLTHERERKQQKAAAAKTRFEFREYRLERNKKERDAMLAEKKRALQKKMAEQSKREKIQAALERVEKKRAQKKAE